MPITPTYPGVYVEEIPSGVRTITGVATSITAFIGFALQGPTNNPIRIQNFGDFERKFGGLWSPSMMGYAVQQFFLNGGSDALIVRLANPGAQASKEFTAGSSNFTLKSFAPGPEGNSLKVIINYDDNEDGDEESFNLIVTQGGDDQEVFKAKLKKEDLKNTLNAGKLLRYKGDDLPQRPDATSEPQALTGGGQNGGKSAKFQFDVPVKVQNDGNDLTDATDTLTLAASSEGTWGNNLTITVDHDTVGDNKATTFNINIRWEENNTLVAEETLRNLSMDEESSRYIVEVLKADSSLIQVDDLPEGEKIGRPNEDEKTVISTNRGEDGIVPEDDGLYLGSRLEKTGLYALEKADLFNLLCIPPVRRKIDITSTTWSEAAVYCAERRAMLLIDPPLGWTTKDKITNNNNKALDDILGPIGSNKKNAAIFFPRIKYADSLKENRIEEFVPSASLAGIFSRTDTNRGVWKAPAGIEASINGARGLSVGLTDGENGQLNPLGLNCLRNFPVYGNVVWGSRTAAGDDRLASEWKYIPVRRLALFLEESLYRGTQWVVFEPNDEPLWAQIRLNLGAFMNNLFKQGAFQGSSPREAYFVKCDSETTTQNDIDRGIVNIIIGYAPLKPAEFVILKFQQIAGQLET